MNKDIKKGTKLYKLRKGEYQEFEVWDIYLESYISDYKTIIKVFKTNQEIKLIETHYASDIGKVLLTSIPEKKEECNE